MTVKPVIPVHWHRSSNFGDTLAPYIVEKVTGKHVVYVEPYDKPNLMVIGSLLNDLRLYQSTIWGCGFPSVPQIVIPPAKILALRGTMSHRVYQNMGLRFSCAYGDPAVLLPNYLKPDERPVFGVGLIPHIVDYAYARERYGDEFECIINLHDPIEDVVRNILLCERTISTSLHGFVVSHAYGRPSAWGELSDRVIGGGWKFRDYLTAYGMEDTDPLDMRKRIDIGKADFILPAESKMKEIQQGLMDAFPKELIG